MEKAEGQLSSVPSFSVAVFLLESPSSSLEEKLNALRFLQHFVENESLDTFTDKIRVNQLVLDNVMWILHREDLIPDLRRRQLIKAECFLMLARVLESKSLFGGTKVEQCESVSEKEFSSSNNGMISHKHQSYLSSTVHDPTKDLYHSLSLKKDPLKVGKYDVVKMMSSRCIALEDEPDGTISKQKNSSLTEPTTESNVDSTETRSSVSAGSLGKSLIGEKSIEMARKNKYSSMKLHGRKKNIPRQSVLSGASIEGEPVRFRGVNSNNFLATDMHLGYQKSRLWVPFAGSGSIVIVLIVLSHSIIDINHDMLPKPRPRGYKELQVERITEDYMKMRALMSYVGDNVAPFNFKGEKAMGSFVTRKTEKMLTNNNSYTDIIKEAVLLWSPLFGATPPHWATNKKKQDSSVAVLSKVTSLKNTVRSEQISRQQKEMAIEGARSILITKGSLRRLLRNELILNEKSKEAYRKSLDLISKRDDSFDSHSVQNAQKEILISLEREKEATEASCNAVNSMLLDTVKVQYASLPPRYLLVADRGQAKSRNVFERAMITFGNRRRLNYLALSLGIWKIALIEGMSLSQRPIYSKRAAVILLSDWASNRKTRKIKLWFVRWKVCISKSIFLERIQAALPIQCLYRVWRDRNKFIRLHLAGPYNGPLSDIYLAPSRGKAVKFSIPRLIRSSRRMYWQAAILIQTHFRRFILRKEYYIKVRKVLLVQSIIRMYPKWVQYKRLKAATIKCQAYGRRTVKRNYYKRLKYSTIIAQKYVRRFLGQLLRMRLEDIHWNHIELPMSPIIRLQCCWRIYLAKKKCAAIRYRNERLQWAALQLQRCWYRKQNAFHTFMLMCAYREIERQDAELDKLSYTMGWNCCSRVIQKYYRDHYYVRIIRNAIFLQCWYRGRKGKQRVQKMRLVCWASRKLHHWARSMMKYKHKCSKRIAFAWFRAQPGRFRRNLQNKIRLMDIRDDKQRRERQAVGAAKIQSMVYARKAREYVKELRAALVIQRSAKFWVARLMWKKQVYEQKHGWLLDITNKFMHSALQRATHYICVRQNAIARHVQAIARGFLCRRAMFHARVKARRMGIATIKLQRFWRASDSFMKAVQEVMALRRLQANPYRDCDSVHHVLTSLRGDAKRYYHFKDPRAGQLTSSFLQRTGLTELLPIFAKDEKYKFVSSLRSFTVEKLIAHSKRWLKKEDKKFKSKNIKPPKFEESLFESLVAYLKPPLQPTRASDLDALKGIQCIQEIMNRDVFMKKFSDAFIKRFGNSFATRAENLSIALGVEFWNNFNNFKAVNYVLTEALVARIFKICKTPAEVKPAITKLTQPRKPEVGMSGKVHPQVQAEKKWDLERLKRCADIYQSATERALVLLPDGIIREMLTEVGVTTSAYKRRFSRQIVSLQAAEAEQRAKTIANKEKNTLKKRKSKKKLTEDQQSESDAIDTNESRLLESSGVSVCSLQESIDRKFCGSADESEIELYVNICKLYMDVHEKLYIATKGINSIKNHWFNSAMARTIREDKRRRFLEAAKDQYVEERHENHVQKVWTKLRKLEDIKWREEAIMQSVMEYTNWAKSQLDFLVRFGWVEYLDDSGYSYYYNEDIPDGATYEMPRYTLAEWRAVSRVQWAAGRFLERVRERRRIRDAEKQKAIANHERLQAQLLAKSKQSVTASVNLVQKSIRRICAYRAADHRVVDHSPEIFLPYKYRFTDDKLYSPQEWVLVRFDEDPPRYVNGLVLKFSKTKLTYNIRLVSGAIVKNVDPKRVFKMNYDKGTLVEARYRGDPLFYRGKVTNVRKSADKSETVYSILYDDGEFEERVASSFIRPSPAGILAFLKERNRLLAFYKKREQRSNYYATLRSERLQRHADMAKRREEEFYEAWKDATGRSTRKSIIPGSSVLTMIAASSSLRSFRYSSRVRIFYTKACLRFDWYEVKTGEKDGNGDPVVTFKNYVTEEESNQPPMYTSAEHFHVLKIQSAWSVYLARRNLKRLLLQESMLSIATRAIRQYQKYAYIGYKFEGVNFIQYMRRAGHKDAADSMTSFFRSRPIQFSALTINSFLALPKEKLGSTVGLTRHADVQSFLRFRDWWKNTKPSVKESQLSFINSFDGPNDLRPMRKCVLDGEYLIRPKISRAYKNSASRVKSILEGILKSYFPISKMMLDSFLEEFAGKAGVAQERVDMLVDQPVVHTYVEEKEAYDVLKSHTRRIIYMLKNMKINVLRRACEAALKRAEELIEKVHSKYEGKPRPLISDAEARAALILRTEVMDYILRIEDAAALIQRRIRGLTKRLMYLRITKTRTDSAVKLQAFFRARLAQTIAEYLRAQKSSNWEQLWDDNRRCIYFFNKFTNTATYDDPLVPCRPLVRDLRSSALIQAWPDLEGNAKGYDINETDIVVIKSKETLSAERMQNVTSTCSLCQERKTRRVCQDCNEHKGASYCFPCFSSVHSNDPERINHVYRDLPEVAVDVLTCVECDEPATRKCMGVLDEKEIDALCGRLQRAKASSWVEVLRDANVGGERKLTIMLDQFLEGANSEEAILNSAQLQQVRTILERTRAECDECYCDECYIRVHSGGKRVLHRWIGFQAGATVCKVCTRAPAEVDCQECEGGIYCRSCFKVFHSKGRKKKHIFSVIKEDISGGQEHCSMCRRRVATTSCGDCLSKVCNSCLECSHKGRCPVALDNQAEGQKDGAGKCVSCGEAADQLCVQCGDLYCSRTWMGNPGCFLDYHSRGNRVNHVLQPLEGESAVVEDNSNNKKRKKKSKGLSDKGKHALKNQHGKLKLPGIKP